MVVSYELLRTFTNPNLIPVRERYRHRAILYGYRSRAASVAPSLIYSRLRRAHVSG